MVTTQKATKLFKDDQITYLIIYSMNLEKLRSKKTYRVNFTTYIKFVILKLRFW